METSGLPKLSSADERTLRLLAHADEAPVLDWVALQHLRQLGLAEDVAGRWRITEEGKRAIGIRRK